LVSEELRTLLGGRITFGWGQTSPLKGVSYMRLRSLVGGLILMAVSSVVAQEPTTPTPSAKKAPEYKAAIKWKRFDYTCEGTVKLTVYLHEQTAKIRFKDAMYLMRQVPSADGARYSDGKVIWWGVGTGGFLQEDTPDGDGKMIVKDCKLDKPTTGGAAKP
jgi:membrane-bound inhibitor of C-type lysozyme